MPGDVSYSRLKRQIQINFSLPKFSFSSYQEILFEIDSDPMLITLPEEYNSKKNFRKIFTNKKQTDYFIRLIITEIASFETEIPIQKTLLM